MTSKKYSVFEYFELILMIIKHKNIVRLYSQVAAIKIIKINHKRLSSYSGLHDPQFIS